MTAHWGIEDPPAVEGPDIEKERAFVQAFKFLKNRIAVLMALPMASLYELVLTITCGNRPSRGRDPGHRSSLRPPLHLRCTMDVIIYHNPGCGMSATRWP